MKKFTMILTFVGSILSFAFNGAWAATFFEGTVFYADGASEIPATNERIYFGNIWSSTDEEGYFLIVLDPGVYKIHMKHMDHDEECTPSSFVITPMTPDIHKDIRCPSPD